MTNNKNNQEGEKETKKQFLERIKNNGVYVQCPDCMSDLRFRFEKKVKSGNGWYGWCHGDEFTCENTCDTKLEIEHLIWLLSLREKHIKDQQNKILRLNEEMETLKEKLIRLI